MASQDKIRELWVEYMRVYLKAKRGTHTNYGAGTLKWDGGVDKYNKKNKNAWEELANFASSNKLNKRRWMDALFSTWAVPRDPSPYDLKSLHIVEAAQKAVADKPDKKLLRQLQEKYFMNHLDEWMFPPFSLSKEHAAARVLLDDHLPFTPLFRYCWLDRLRIPGKDRYLTASLRQIASDRADYIKYWSDLIPTNLINME
jgi:hypothetical protein